MKTHLSLEIIPLNARMGPYSGDLITQGNCTTHPVARNSGTKKIRGYN